MTIEFKGGRLPNDPAKPRLSLGPFLNRTIPAPESVDYITGVTSYPMYLNDRIGDCTCAGAGHIIQAESTYGQHVTQSVTDAAVLKAYEDVSGYDPKTGANDNGAVMQDVLNYWRKTGIGSHKILAFAELNVNDITEVKLALDVFGSVYLGINFPNTAMDQFNSGKPWDFVPGANIEGGHAIHGGAYNIGADWKVTTWGQIHDMTQAFWNNYVEEAWVVITPEWLDHNGNSPTGLNLNALGEELAAITGGVNPFQPSPTPQPIPTPTPVPTPPPAPVDDFVGYAREWLNKKHYFYKTFQNKLREWVDNQP